MKVVEEILNKYMSCIEEEASNYASQFSFLGIEFDDLYQEGMIGLLKAYHHSDNIGLSYSYVSKYIKCEMLRYITANSFGVKIPEFRVLEIHAVMEIDLKYYKNHGKEAPISYLIKTLEEKQIIKHSITPELVLYLRKLNFLYFKAYMLSLSNIREDMLVTNNMEEEIIDSSLCDSIKSMISRLDDRSRKIVEMAIGFYQGKPSTFRDIGKATDLSYQGAYKIYKKSIEKIHNEMKK